MQGPLIDAAIKIALSGWAGFVLEREMCRDRLTENGRALS